MAQHTKNAIRRGFLELLNQRPFDRISVVDIAQHSEINRNTFYYYYEDIFALVEDVLEIEWEKIWERHGSGSWESVYLAYTEFIRGNKRAVTHLVNSSNRDRLERCFYRSTLEAMTAVVRRMSQGLSISEGELQRIALFHTATLVGLEMAWILGGMKDDAGEQLRETGRMMEASLYSALERASRCA